MTRLMYDTTDIPALSIPPTAQMVAGYVNGREPSFGAVVARAPGAAAVSISVNSSGSADVGDVEAGDMTPADTHDWITRQKARGLFRPSIYCERSAYTDVRNGTREYVLGVDYDLWIADWTGQPHALGLGEAAVQFANPAMIPGHPNVDLSLVIDDGWPHRAPSAADPPAPVPPITPPPAPAPPIVAPPFPLPPGHWYGVRSSDPRNHSGFFPVDRAGVAEFQNQLRQRGWAIAADGMFGPATQGVVLAFQREKGLAADGLVGPITWATIWTAPVT